MKSHKGQYGSYFLKRKRPDNGTSVLCCHKSLLRMLFLIEKIEFFELRCMSVPIDINHKVLKILACPFQQLRDNTVSSKNLYRFVYTFEYFLRFIAEHRIFGTTNIQIILKLIDETLNLSSLLENIHKIPPSERLAQSYQ